jgi:hypothetical protein
MSQLHDIKNLPKRAEVKSLSTKELILPTVLFLLATGVCIAPMFFSILPSWLNVLLVWALSLCGGYTFRRALNSHRLKLLENHNRALDEKFNSLQLSVDKLSVPSLPKDNRP